MILFKRLSLFLLSQKRISDTPCDKGNVPGSVSDEQEWFEFKENWFQAEALGEYEYEYESALSNAATFHYK